MRTSTLKQPTTTANFRRLAVIHMSNYINSGNAITRYLPLLQYRHPQLLNQEQRETLFNSLSRFVGDVEHAKFGKRSDRLSEVHLDRVLGLVEIAEAKWTDSPRLICAKFNRGFYYIEAVLALRRIGVRFHILDYNAKEIVHFVDYFAWKRSGIPEYHIWYRQRYGKELQADAYKKFVVRSLKLEEIISRSTYPVYGFEPAISYEFMTEIEDCEEHTFVSTLTENKTRRRGFVNDRDSIFPK